MAARLCRAATALGNDGENLGEELTGVRERYRRRFGDGKGWKADGGTRPSGGARRMTPRRRGVEASAPGEKRGRGGARSSSSRVHARTGSLGARRQTATARTAGRQQWRGEGEGKTRGIWGGGSGFIGAGNVGLGREETDLVGGQGCKGGELAVVDACSQGGGR
uniref:Uncharacterized protein n=1 Tax=Oryza sativa subsp. japonica TaxID=39947 RepID=Q6K7X6_ORYSJ|nr:hypothetical protein [Oryza sativa Japonica Group]BAD19464.1 hypothetical protein [Oryza sativa Japonica Group]